MPVQEPDQKRFFTTIRIAFEYRSINFR